MSQTAMIVLGFLVIFLATTAGSAIVWFFKRDISDKVNTLFLGFASGIMVAASVWSLIIPSIEGAESWGKWNFVPALIGFLLGGLFLVLLDHVVPHFHKGTNEEEGPRSSLKKSTKMFLAVTIHNIPEGLAVGFAFGAAAAMGEYSAYVSALALAIGIAIQNFPEGAAVALPMKSATQSRGESLFVRNGKRRGRASVCDCRFLSRFVAYDAATVVSGVCCGCNDICSRGRSHSRRAPFRTSAFRHMGCNARLCRDDGAGRRFRIKDYFR